MISSGAPTEPRFQHRQHGLQVGQLLLVQQDVGIFQFGLILSALVTKYGDR
jgi:hypothetical protein